MNRYAISYLINATYSGVISVKVCELSATPRLLGEYEGKINRKPFTLYCD